MEIIRPNTKKVEEERKKKEEKGRNKSPLKHFSGLKTYSSWTPKDIEYNAPPYATLTKPPA